jgi:hypothetical protein
VRVGDEAPLIFRSSFPEIAFDWTVAFDADHLICRLVVANLVAENPASQREFGLSVDLRFSASALSGLLS